MSTFIHGIGASEMIDSSGEVISIQGMDISSLPRDGVFNWEHKKDTPMQTVGKVLKAKKIFSPEDCEDEHQLYFWNKVNCPYIYVMGELLDDYTEAAAHVAGMFKYDADRKGQQEFNIISFSIEGATIEKLKGSNVVSRSIARKVTLTNLPCNKTAGAEMVEAKGDDLHDLFKTENPGILVLRVEPPKRIASDMMKHAKLLGIPMFKTELPKTTQAGTSIGATTSGKNVMSHGKVHEYHKFTHADHSEAAELHQQAAHVANKAGNRGLVDNHLEKKKLHLAAASTAKARTQRYQKGREQRYKKLGVPMPPVAKAMTAGSGNAAPGQLTGGAALAKESLDKKIHKGSDLNGIGKPMGTNFKAKDLRADMPHRKAGMGTSHMGYKVRGGDETSLTAKDVAKKNVKRIQNAPKPNLAKDETPAAAPAPTLGQTATSNGTSTINASIGSPFGKKENIVGPAGAVAKGHLTGGCKIQKEKPLKKSFWVERAEEEYKNWNKRDQFVAFMQKRMPNLTKGEIDAIGQTMALKKALEAEEKLAKLEKSLKK